MASKIRFLTLYKIEGHKTWRMILANDEDVFDKQMAHDKQKVTNIKVFFVDCIEGTVKPQ